MQKQQENEDNSNHDKIIINFGKLDDQVTRIVEEEKIPKIDINATDALVSQKVRLNEACFEKIKVIGKGGFGKVWKVTSKLG